MVMMMMMRRSRGMESSAGAMGSNRWNVLGVCVLAVVSFWSFAHGATDQADVEGLNQMFSDFNNPSSLTNWVQSAGDPCGNNWLGISCSGSSVTSIQLSNKGLNGKVQGWVLQKFQHLTTLDLSHNNLNQDIPNMFPPNLFSLHLEYNQFTGQFPYLLINIPSLTGIYMSNNKLNGDLNSQIFSKLVNLVTLDLSNNDFTGTIPDTVGDLVSLQTLYLQNNQLNGSLPTTLAQLTNLQTLDVSNNQLSGYIPPGLNPKTFNYGGNQISSQAPPPPPYTAPPPPKNSPPKNQPSGSSSSSSPGFFTPARSAGVAIVILLVLLAAGLAVWCFVLRKKPEKSADEEANSSSRCSWLKPLIPSAKAEKTTKLKVFEPAAQMKGVEEPVIKALPPQKTLTLKAPPAFFSERSVAKKATGKVNKSNIAATAFSVADLQAATNSFSEDNLIGEGGLGRVYRADFPNGQVLAVKKVDSKASMVQNEDDFLSVVEGLARLQHANATELVGYCVEHDQRLLVYEYIGRGTLNELLHASSDNTKGLSWNVRVKIALGAARALEYLHEVCAPPVVHRNFKSANILLDDELNPHISDCGLAALAPSGSERQVSAQMLGSFGYSAPEYAMSGTYTVKSDVYSFGVVMLELLTGRKPVDSSRPRSEQSLVRWATPQLHDIDALARMVDPALKGVYPAKSLSRFADVVALCVQPEPEFRPPMSEVVQALVRLMQRASLSKRRTESEVGPSQSEAPEASENSG